MKNVWVTGEQGYIAYAFKEYSKYNLVNNLENNELDYFRNSKNEVDIFDPSLEKIIKNANTDFIVNAVTCHDGDLITSIKTHIEGSIRVALIAKNLDIPIYNIVESTEDLYIYPSKNTAAKLIKNYLECNNIYIGRLYGKEDFNRSINIAMNDSYLYIYSSPDAVTTNKKIEVEFLYIKDFIKNMEYIIDNNINEDIKIDSEKIDIFDVIDFLEKEDLVKEFNIQKGIECIEEIPNDIKHLSINISNWKDVLKND
jgi:hypothetical protein